jgi:hypothetical protein
MTGKKPLLVVTLVIWDVLVMGDVLAIWDARASTVVTEQIRAVIGGGSGHL